MAEADDYTLRAMEEIRRHLNEQLAMVHAELEARIAEASFAGSPDNINPHHITSALRELRRAGEVVWNSGSTRGGHDIATVQPAEQYKRRTRIESAAARKRLLYARYTGWAQGTKRHPRGLIGPAGEQAVRGGILASGALQPAAPGAGEVRELLGVALPGPADSAGFMVPLLNGVPGPTVTMIFEVKNGRSWIYPSSIELYQVLHKGALLQDAHPQQDIVPVLACRVAHKTTFWMAQQLGFVVIDMGRQVIGDVSEPEMLEVRNELHFHDLAIGVDPSLRVRDRLRRSLPPRCNQIAATWRRTCLDSRMTEGMEALRRSTDESERAQLMRRVRQVNRELGRRGGW